jgi:hypothetical protein
MGDEIAQEVLKAWYEFRPELGGFQGIDTGLVEDVERAVCADIFNVNRKPWKVLRELSISQDLVTRSLNPKDGKKIADILLRIEKRATSSFPSNSDKSTSGSARGLQFLALLDPL